jgi:hypothetical protein
MKPLRSTTQKMFKSKFGTYLFYALGEIPLVVIGILLAVQIDNWNENRKTRESEQLMLKALLAEMTDNRKYLLTTMAFEEGGKNAALKLKDIYNTDHHKFKTNQLDSLFGQLLRNISYDPRVSVINSIKLSGQLGTIRNSKIQDFITSFEEFVSNTKLDAAVNRSLTVNRYAPLVSKYISLNNLLKYIGLERGGAFLEIDGSKFESNYEDLFKDREMESLVIYMYGWWKVELTGQQELLKMLDETISIVKSELAK